MAMCYLTSFNINYLHISNIIRTFALPKKRKNINKMFTIYCSNIGGRKHDLYFKSWENAKESLLNDLKRMTEQFGWKQTRKTDEFNADKGLYAFQYNLITNEGEEVVLSLIDAYFND